VPDGVESDLRREAHMATKMMITKRTNNVMSGTIILKEEGETGGMIRTRASEACCGAIIKRKSYFSSRHGDINSPYLHLRSGAHICHFPGTRVTVTVESESWLGLSLVLRQTASLFAIIREQVV